jgi:hypothetical protein
MLTFFPDMVSIGHFQKTFPKRSILAPIKKPKLFPENQPQMQHSRLLIIPDHVGSCKSFAPTVRLHRNQESKSV